MGMVGCARAPVFSPLGLCGAQPWLPASFPTHTPLSTQVIHGSSDLPSAISLDTLPWEEAVSGFQPWGRSLLSVHKHKKVEIWG